MRDRKETHERPAKDPRKTREKSVTLEPLELVKHVPEIVGELNHLVVLLRGEVVEVEVAWVNGFVLVAHFVV